jgi:hypothetical protein
MNEKEYLENRRLELKAEKDLEFFRFSLYKNEYELKMSMKSEEIWNCTKRLEAITKMDESQKEDGVEQVQEEI